MLTQKKSRKNNLSPIEKRSAKIITLNTPSENEAEVSSKKKDALQMPPVTQFNTGYIKAKDHDIL